MECCAVQCHAMKQTAQISTHDLAFNDIRKTSCCLQSSSNFNKLTDITKHTHADIHFTMLYMCACVSVPWLIFIFAECIGPFDCAFDMNTCNGHSARRTQAKSFRLRLALDCSAFGCKHLARLLLMSFVRVKQRMYSMYFIYFTFISPKVYMRIPRKKAGRLFGYTDTHTYCAIVHS